MVADGQRAINGLRGFRALAKDEEHFLVHLHAHCQPGDPMHVPRAPSPKIRPRLIRRVAPMEMSTVLVVRHSARAFPMSNVVSHCDPLFLGVCLVSLH